MFSETYSIKPNALVFLTKFSVLTLIRCSPRPLTFTLYPGLEPAVYGASAFSILKSISSCASFKSMLISLGM